MFKNKGAVVVLIWSFCGFSVIHSLYATHFSYDDAEQQVGVMTIHNLHVVPFCFFLYPIFGWLADTRFGRYKVIRWSLIVLWILSIIFCILSLLQLQYFSNRVSKFLRLWNVLLAIALCGIIANIAQFSTDQLYDASSSDIVSLIRWWAWVWSLSAVATALGQSCFCKQPALANLYLPAVITVAVCFDLLFNSWLIKESPPTSRPLTNVYKVVCYAIRHKYPMRSAPIDWDKRHSARLDVGKSKYGGPFTSEEVDDVKTFFRITAVISVGIGFYGLYFAVLQFFPNITAVLNHKSPMIVGKICDQNFNCFKVLTVTFTGDIIVVFLIPLFELVIFPLVRSLLRWHFSISILRKSFLGMFLAILSVISAILIVFVAQQNSTVILNGTCSCKTDIEPTISFVWMMIPHSLASAVQLIAITSSAEFIIAQSPYSLRGFIFGMAYGFIGLSILVGASISLALQSIAQKWLFKPYGCTFWYLILTLLVSLIFIAVAGVSFKCYKRRQREDQQAQLFAMDY